MKIRKLQLKNIGVFDDETIEFQPCPVKDKAEIHILTGQNGSGKSTVLHSLAGLFSLNSREDDIRLLLNLKDNNLGNRLRKKSSAEINFTLEDKDFTQEYDFSVSKGDGEKYVQAVIRYQETSITKKLHHFLQLQIKETNFRFNKLFSFAAFAYSGYRRVKDEKINLFDEAKEHPLQEALNFSRDENSNFSVNQWLGNNLSKRALAVEDKSEETKKFAENIKNLEKAIADIVGYDITFKLRTDLSLVIIKDEQELKFDVLPDGLKSLISWIGDLLMRLDSLKWENDLPVFEREIVLFLDEIEVHLHPKWQRKVLPVVQKLFKNAQIFVSTHSPFVVNSVDDAWVYKLELENGKAKVASPIKSEDGYSYQTVLREIFDIDKRFGEEAQKELDEFYTQSKAILNANGNGKVSKEKFLAIANHLASQSAELQSLVFLELARLSKEAGEPYQI